MHRPILGELRPETRDDLENVWMGSQVSAWCPPDSGEDGGARESAKGPRRHTARRLADGAQSLAPAWVLTPSGALPRQEPPEGCARTGAGGDSPKVAEGRGSPMPGGPADAAQLPREGPPSRTPGLRLDCRTALQLWLGRGRGAITSAPRAGGGPAKAIRTGGCREWWGPPLGPLQGAALPTP